MYLLDDKTIIHKQVETTQFSHANYKVELQNKIVANLGWSII